MERAINPRLRLSSEVLDAISKHNGLVPDELEVKGVSGGYSRNVRMLYGHGDRWVFVKEVDHEVLPGDGTKELSWLRKDYNVMQLLRDKCPDIVPEWAELLDDEHTLLLPAYRAEDGWMWSPPTEDAELESYIDAIIGRTVELEGVQLNANEQEKLQAEPYFRDKLALDDGYDMVIGDPEVRERLKQKYAELLENPLNDQMREAIYRIAQVIDNLDQLNSLARKAKLFIEQPNDVLGHCDVRSDNVAYNVRTGEARFVDWNWMSYTPKSMGASEFLVDMARRGVNVERWAMYLNPDMLAAVVGFYLKRCLEEPLAPGNTLREVQAESAAITLMLYEQVS